MTNKEKLLQDLFAAIEKEHQLEIDYQIAQWETEKAREAYLACLRAERVDFSKIEFDGAESVAAINKATINKGGQPQ